MLQGAKSGALGGKTQRASAPVSGEFKASNGLANEDDSGEAQCENRVSAAYAPFTESRDVPLYSSDDDLPNLASNCDLRWRALRIGLCCILALADSGDDDDDDNFEGSEEQADEMDVRGEEVDPERVDATGLGL